MKMRKDDVVRFMVDSDGYPVSHYHNDIGGFRPSWKKFSVGVITSVDEEHIAYRVQFMINEDIRDVWFCSHHIEAYDGIAKAQEKEAYAPSDPVYAPSMGVAKVAIWSHMEYVTPDECTRAFQELNTLLRRKLRAWPWGFELREDVRGNIASLVWVRSH